MTSPLLTTVQLERFKAAFKPDEVRLGRFNVVIGRNGSGKSTLLEALQWLDTTLRHDTRRASERYYGIRDLVNLRNRKEPPYFGMRLGWGPRAENVEWTYELEIIDDEGVARIGRESLTGPKGGETQTLSETGAEGHRLVSAESGQARTEVREPDRLALGHIGDVGRDTSGRSAASLRDFWERAVFLRLSPNRLAFGSPAKRTSYEPMLDEEGQMLPALLNELDDDQREGLVEAIGEVLPGISGIEVSEASGGRDLQVHYSLLETMPYRGRLGKSDFPIPAWMLSEGTRRITAILALIHHHPAPSLLCIEEVDNGLDPWTVRTILGHLIAASERGVQVVVSTHSPWLLDHVPIESIIQVRRTEGDTRYERFAERPEIRAYDPSIPAGTRYVNEAE